MFSRFSSFSQENTIQGSNEALMRRLHSMHRFLEGQTGVEDFGEIHFARDDLNYGLGLGLRSGSLHEFFARACKASPNAEELMNRWFDEDGAEILKAVGKGQTEFVQYVESQLILTYDAVLSRKMYQLSPAWQTRFERLAAEPLARMIQIDIVAGDRFLLAQKHAKIAGIKSLRGFAMLFELYTLVDSNALNRVKSCATESEKCLALADTTLARMNGNQTGHWHALLSSIFRGYGRIGDRYYNESQFLGEISGKSPWENAKLSDPDTSPQPIPLQGNVYRITPGDNLKTLSEKVYGSRMDPRFILRQNPQIQSPGDFRPGARIFLPESGTPASDEVSEDSTKPVFMDDFREIIMVGNREIGPLTFMTKSEINRFYKILQDIPDGQLRKTCVLHDSDHTAILCGNTCLWTAPDYLGNSPDTLGQIQRTAAQIRGNLDLGNGIFLPFADLPSQPNRRDWIATALKCAGKSKLTENMHLILYPANKCVDLSDGLGNSLVRLEKEDFYEIRMQPLRRLNDYMAPPIVQMEDLSQLWIADYLGIRTEIAVPPVNSADQLMIHTLPKETRIDAPVGTPVYAMMRGQVLNCGRISSPKGCNANYEVWIKHCGGLICRYSGLAAICVQPQKQVFAETIIGRSGSLHDLTIQCSQTTTFQQDSLLPSFLNAVDYFDVVCRLWTDGAKLDCALGR